MNIDIASLAAWEGRSETRCEHLGAAQAAAMAALMDRAQCDFADGDPLPPAWHWLYFLPRARQSELGDDGHPLRGGFLPPVPLPRRMWASGRLRFEDALRIGDRVTRSSRIESVRLKEGRASGPLVIVTLCHELATARGRAITETQVVVYRGEAGSAAQAAGTPAPTGESWRMDMTADPVLLFRYSALTFNGHRIHYDRDYATRVEHYPGLVVHGPLLASLLLELLHRELPQRRVASFAFRAVQPLFESSPFAVCAGPAAEPDGIALWTRNAAGELTMDATATLA